MKIFKNINKSFLSILFFVLNIGILVFLILTDKDLKQNPMPGIGNFNHYIIFIAVIFMLLYMFMDIIKTYILIKFYTGRKMIWLSIKTTVIGKYYDNITPTTTGGQPFQIQTLRNKDISGIHSSGIILIKFFMFQAVFFVYGFMSLLINIIFDVKYDVFLYIAFAISLSLNFIIPCIVYYLATHKHTTGRIMYFFLIIGEKLHIIKSKKKTIRKLLNLSSKFSSTFDLLKKNKRKLITIVILTFAEIAFFLLIPFILYIGYNPGIITNPNFIWTFGNFMCSYLFIYFVMSIFPLPGGTGAAEFGFKWLMAGLFFDETITAIVLWRGITYYLPLVIGLFFIIHNVIGKFKSSRPQ